MFSHLISVLIQPRQPVETPLRMERRLPWAVKWDLILTVVMLRRPSFLLHENASVASTPRHSCSPSPGALRAQEPHGLPHSVWPPWRHLSPPKVPQPEFPCFCLVAVVLLYIYTSPNSTVSFCLFPGFEKRYRTVPNPCACLLTQPRVSRSHSPSAAHAATVQPLSLLHPGDTQWVKAGDVLKTLPGTKQALNKLATPLLKFQCLTLP